MKLATIANGSVDGKLVVVSIDGELYLDASEAAPTWQAALEHWDDIDETDGRLRDAGLTLERGSVIRIVDMMPGGVSPMHRTNSIDCGIVLSGEVELDAGAKTLLGPGDVIVQRGTIHLWRNRSATDVCRIVFVLTEAAAYSHNGLTLAEVKP
jgi:quercetin dioxygenase-like cupin family protein